MKNVFHNITSYLRKIFMLTIPYFLVELLAFLTLFPENAYSLAFGACWAVLLSALCLLLPRLAGRIFFGITYYFMLLWTLAQIGYHSIFTRMLWLSEMFYAGEGADYITDVLSAFPFLWWLGGLLLLTAGGLVIWKFPKGKWRLYSRFPYFAVAVSVTAFLVCLPEIVFLRDLNVWGTRSEYAQSSSYRATYTTMYDAKNVYNICGVYQLTFRDVWVHHLYPLTPAYRQELQAQTEEIKTYFAQRPQKQKNEMTGAFAGKNVIMVLMESMDDWMITPEDTPTLYKLMQEGITFTDFYTPGFGTARTINSEFCANTGIYLPTTGDYVFDYVTNDFSQSIASQMAANGYTSEVFHYNSPDFYSRGVFEPAMGYGTYNYYEAFESDEDKLFDDCLLFDIPEISEKFFREGQTFNTIITRSAHLSYKYNEVLSHYALKQYPEYRGKYGSEEENCARVKAKLVDDMFARLLQELEKRNQLENTVIMAVTDHYTYGYQNLQELYSLSGVDNKLLLEKTPCFVWSAESPAMEVDKTLNTSDFLPTMLNLLGIDSPYSYLGQDAFDPNYQGYALFPDGSWICDGVVCQVDAGGKATILQNQKDMEITKEKLEEMAELSRNYIRISNLLLTANYYQIVWEIG